MHSSAHYQLIEKLQDDIVYVLEDLLYDYRGEAKEELRDMLGGLDAQAGILGPALAEQLRELLTQAREEVRGGGRQAYATLIALRRGLRNLQLTVSGRPEQYPYATALAALPVTATR